MACVVVGVGCVCVCVGGGGPSSVEADGRSRSALKCRCRIFGDYRGDVFAINSGDFGTPGTSVVVLSAKVVGERDVRLGEVMESGVTGKIGLIRRFARRLGTSGYPVGSSEYWRGGGGNAGDSDRNAEGEIVHEIRGRRKISLPPMLLRSLEFRMIHPQQPRAGEGRSSVGMSPLYPRKLISGRR